MNEQNQAVRDDSHHRDIITAIDIGTTKIVALVGRKNRRDRFEILGEGTQNTTDNTVKRGVVLNIEKASEVIMKAVRQAEEQSGIKITNAFVGIAGQHITSRKESHNKVIRTSEKVITQEILEEMKSDLYQLALEPGNEIIHIIPQSYKVDKESGVVNPCGMYASKITGNYNVIVGETESVKNILKCFDRVNIRINDLFLEPLASSAAVLTEEEREAGVALVDIGGGTTDLAVYYDKILKHTAVIPLGGNIVTSDIIQGCQILHKVAEKIKLDFGSALSEGSPGNKVISIPGINGRKQKEIPIKVLSKIIQARMEEIIEFVDYELKNSGVKDMLGAGIVITGGGSLLRQLVQLFGYKTGLEVKLAYPGQYLTSDNRTVNSPKYSTAVGLIMLGHKNRHKIQPDPIEKDNQTNQDQDNGQEQAMPENSIAENDHNVRRGFTGFFENLRKNLEAFLAETDSDIDEQ